MHIVPHSLPATSHRNWLARPSLRAAGWDTRRPGQVWQIGQLAIEHLLDLRILAQHDRRGGNH